MNTKQLKFQEKNSESRLTAIVDNNDSQRIRILFFIGSLRFGGTERRFVELLKYLNNSRKYELLVVLAYDKIDYSCFSELKIRQIKLDKKPNFKDLKIFFILDEIVREFKPSIIHTWGAMPTFYMIPASKMRGIPIVNSQITNAKPNNEIWSFDGFINTVNFSFSDVVLANSYAGLKAYRVIGKRNAQVIYNGVDLNRFQNLPGQEQMKRKYHIVTPYCVVMAASFNKNKDYELFYQVAKLVNDRRQDISFIGIGRPSKNTSKFERLSRLAKKNTRILFPGPIDDVEALVNACDIGVLFTDNRIHGEGISNAIIEYMALGKPVIANDIGGTCEIVRDQETGFLVSGQPKTRIADIIIDLIENPEKREVFGQKGKQVIRDKFNLETMGCKYEHLYKKLLVQKLQVESDE